MPAKPKIKLETLTQRKANLVLGVTYLTVILAVVLGVLEKGLRYDELVLPGDICVQHWSEGRPCTVYNGQNSTWAAALDFELLELYFSLSVQIDRGNTPQRQSVNRLFEANVELWGVPIDSGSGQADDSYSRGFNTSLSPSYEMTPNNDDSELLFKGNNEFRLQCNQGDTTCQAVTLLTEAEYELFLVKQYRTFNVSVEYFSFNLLDYGTPTYTVYYHDLHFKYAEMTFHGVFCVVTFLYCVHFLWTLHKVPRDEVLREQIWVLMILFFLFWYQNPFFIPLMLYQVRSLWLMSASTEMLAVAAMFTFWLLLVDGMTLNDFKRVVTDGDDEKVIDVNTPPVSTRSSMAEPDSSDGTTSTSAPGHVKSPSISRPSLDEKQFVTRREWVDFYKWKIAFFCVFVGSTQALVFVSNSILYQQFSESLLTTESIRHYLASVILISVAFVCLMWWAVWFWRVFHKTSRALGRMNYISTRFRQLSFRFFIIQSVLVVIYFLVFIVVRIVQKSPYFGIFNESFATFVLFSVYCFITAYIYLPAKDQGFLGFNLDHKALAATFAARARTFLTARSPLIGSPRRHTRSLSGGALTEGPVYFSVHRAYWLCYFAYQAYYDTPNETISTSSFGHLDLIKQFGYYVGGSCHEDAFDTHVIFAVSRRDNAMVVAFRGSASKQNLKMDFKFRRVALNLPCVKRWHASLSEELKIALTGEKEPKVHTGFWISYNSIRQKLLDKFVGTYEPLAALSTNKPTVYITGHSLGGAMANLLGMEIRAEHGVLPQVYTFGSPRLGNHAFARLCDALLPNNYRVCAAKDVVTTFPKFMCLYKHVGMEIIVDRIGNVLISPLYVEKLFRKGRLSFSAHRLAEYMHSLHLAALNTKPNKSEHLNVRAFRLPNADDVIKPDQVSAKPRITNAPSTVGAGPGGYGTFAHRGDRGRLPRPHSFVITHTSDYEEDDGTSGPLFQNQYFQAASDEKSSEADAGLIAGNAMLSDALSDSSDESGVESLAPTLDPQADVLRQLDADMARLQRHQSRSRGLFWC